MAVAPSGKPLPENRRANLPADAVGERSARAEQLARLYLERAYGLLRED